MTNNKYKKFLEENKFLPSKKMGQNFLINESIKKKIVDLLDVKKEDNIIEIGPGLGALTKYLIQISKKITLIELDKRLVEFLKNNFKDIKIYNDDILKFDFNLLDQNQYKVISNLPYSVSSKVIIKILKEEKINFAVFMLQKEMVDRMIAKCGTKKYNNFSVLVSLFCKIEKKIDVSPNSFFPAPEVTSTVISLTKNKDLNFKEFKKIEKFLQNCFSQKRKTIFNNLKNFYDKNKILKILEDQKIDKNTRPEEIEPEIFKRIYKELYEV